MSLVPNVPNEQLIDVPKRQTSNFTWTGVPKPSWVRFFNQLRLLVLTLQNSGTTAQRPTANLFTGMFYFDTTLNKPVWVDKTGTTWIDATGTPV